jgi:hypothetical protein
MGAGALVVFTTVFIKITFLKVAWFYADRQGFIFSIQTSQSISRGYPAQT